MNPVLMVVSHVVAKEPTQMGLIQWDDMVEQLSAAASDPSLGHAVLPG